MKKQIVLSQEEYHDLLALSCAAAVLNDDYIKKLEKNPKEKHLHPMDRSYADSEQTAIFSKLIWLKNEIRTDMEDFLLKYYEGKKLEVWAEEDNEAYL